MIVNLIAAVGPKSELGWQGGLPWDSNTDDPKVWSQVLEDRRLFKRLTQDSDMIAGSKTYEDMVQRISISSLEMTGRRLFRFSRRFDTSPEQFLKDVCDSQGSNPRSIWIVGGAQTYEAFLPWVNGATIISKIRGYTGPADTFLPTSI